MKPVNEKNSPFKLLQKAKAREKLIADLKATMSECQKRIDILPIRDNPEGQRLKKQISTVNIKLSALLENRNPKTALKKKELTGKDEREVMKSKSVIGLP